jgi:hypothetical protein
MTNWWRKRGTVPNARTNKYAIGEGLYSSRLFKESVAHRSAIVSLAGRAILRSDPTFVRISLSLAEASEVEKGM